MKKLTLVVLTLLLAISCKMGQGDSEEYAREWAEEHYGSKYKKVVCQSGDSDDDGYVSCTMFFHDDNRDPLAIECAHGHGNWYKCTKQEGCRMATGKGRR
jgi:hypothetical protein